MWSPAVLLAACLVITVGAAIADDTLAVQLSDSPFYTSVQADDDAISQLDDGIEDDRTREKRGYDETESSEKTGANLNRIENAQLLGELEGNLDSSQEEFDKIQSKRFLSLFRNRPPKSEGYKRGPGFRSWGGKRSRVDSDSGFANMKRDYEYPLPFQQFEKRGKFDGTKRRFQSWGGKRSQMKPLYYGDLRKLLTFEGKRKFSSWGGKRTDADLVFDKKSNNNNNSGKKISFQSWGGKRSDVVNHF